MDDVTQVNLEIKDKSKKESRPGSESKTPLAFHFDSSMMVWLIPLLLVVALTTNIIALKLPFLEIKMFPHDPEAYSIPHTVTLMWVKMKLYWVAILIAGFSLVFPFVKLLSLFSLWYLPMRVSTRGRGLRILGSLGRWSLLDVFVALVLIVLAHEQGSLLVTDVRPGLYLFLVAILLAMSTGEFMAVLHEKTESHPKLSTTKARRPSIGSGWRRLAVPALLLGSLASLLVAVELPFLKITAWYLTDNSYSILETIATLWTTGEPIFAVDCRGGARGHAPRQVAGDLRNLEYWAIALPLSDRDAPDTDRVPVVDDRCLWSRDWSLPSGRLGHGPGEGGGRRLGPLGGDHPQRGTRLDGRKPPDGTIERPRGRSFFQPVIAPTTLAETI